MNRHLHPQPLTKAQFAPFGEVIETTSATRNGMNDGRFERYHGLASLDIAPPESARVDIVRCLQPTSLPYQFDVMERHPLGAQAFIPLSGFEFIVVVAAPGAALDPDGIRAFVSNGRQGIAYHRGTWHMPLIALSAGQSFLVIERSGEEANCDKTRLAEPIVLTEPPVLT